jgi:WD40 repeat protein
VVDTVVGGVTRRALGDTLSTFQPVPGELVGNQNWVWDAEFSPDGTLLGTATGDGHPRIWTADGKTLLSRLPAHEEVSENGGEPTPRFAIDITFSPDFANDSLFATAGRDGAVRVWRWDPGAGEAERVREFRHQRDARSVAFRPAEDGRIRELASGGDDNSVRVWDLETGEQLTELTHGDVVWSVAYSPDGSSLASAGYDGLVRVWDLSAGYVDPLEIPVRAQRGAQPARLGRLAFSNRQHVLGVGSWDLRAYLFNLSVEDVADRSWGRLTRVLAPYECLQYLGRECGDFFQLRTAAAAHPRAPFAEVESPESGGGR